MQTIPKDIISEICGSSLSSVASLSSVSKAFNLTCSKYLDELKEKAADWLDPVLIDKFLIMSERFYNYTLRSYYAEQDSEDISTIFRDKIDSPEFHFTGRDIGTYINPDDTLGPQDNIVELPLKAQIDAALRDEDVDLLKKFLYQPSTYILPIKYNNGCSEILRITIDRDVDILTVISSYESLNGGFIGDMFHDEIRRTYVLLLMIYVKLYDRLDENYKKYLTIRLKGIDYFTYRLNEQKKIDNETYQQVKRIIETYHSAKEMLEKR